MKHSFIRGTLFLFPILFLLSCFGIKPGTMSSSSKNFETFYVGDGTTQYFIKEFKFKEDEGRNEFFVDFTFRDKDSINNPAPVIMNFSFISTLNVLKIDSLNLSNKNISYNYYKPSQLFKEVLGNKIKSRYTLTSSLPELKKLIENDDWLISVYFSDNCTKFKPDGKTKKSINDIYSKVFILL